MTLVLVVVTFIAVIGFLVYSTEEVTQADDMIWMFHTITRQGRNRAD